MKRMPNPSQENDFEKVNEFDNDKITKPKPDMVVTTNNDDIANPKPNLGVKKSNNSDIDNPIANLGV